MVAMLMAIKIKPLEEGGYLATCLPRFAWRRQANEELQGLVARGRTVAEAMEIAQDVARKPHITPSLTDGNTGLEGRISYA
jgi:hypothetical protein